jgi:dTDP-glucose 4,6-dehydratase
MARQSLQDMYVRVLLDRVGQETFPNPEHLDRIEAALRTPEQLYLELRLTWVGGMKRPSSALLDRIEHLAAVQEQVRAAGLMATPLASPSACLRFANRTRGAGVSKSQFKGGERGGSGRRALAFRPTCNAAFARSRGRAVPSPDMPTSLVTGGAGFLGSHLCDDLLARGHRVVCVDNLETGSLDNIRHIRNGAEFRFEMLDITSHYEIDEPIDFVYHMASPASPIDYARLPLHTLKVGAYGTHNSLGVAKKHRARFLLASTSEVYGDPQIHPQPETYWGNVNPIGPRGVYDEAKRYAEALTMAYLRQQGVDTCIARIFNSYGARMRPNDGRAVPTFLRQALTDKPVTVFGDGSQTRSFCYVDDMIRGLVLLAESEVHEPVNIGNPDEMSLLDMARAIVELTESRSEIVFEALPVDDPQVRQPDITKARDLLGWEPEIELRSGLAKTIEHYTKALGEPASR